MRRTMAGRLLLTTASTSLMLASCSLTIDTDRVQCHATSDCADLGFPDMECQESLCVVPEETPFSCLDVEWPLQGTESVETKITARSLVPEPVPGLTIKMCNTVLDTGCESPLAESVTDVDGIATQSVVAGFRGHFFLPSQSAAQAPYILHMTPPPNPEAPSTLESGITITSLQTIKDLSAVAQQPFVDGRGHFFFTARGCDGQVLSGVKITIVDAPEDLVVAYLDTTGLPDLSLADSGTGASGRGAIINVQTGFVTVRASHDDVGKIFEQVLLFAADTVTTTTVVPSVF